MSIKTKMNKGDEAEVAGQQMGKLKRKAPVSDELSSELNALLSETERAEQEAKVKEEAEAKEREEQAALLAAYKAERWGCSCGNIYCLSPWHPNAEHRARWPQMRVPNGIYDYAGNVIYQRDSYDINSDYIGPNRVPDGWKPRSRR